MIDGPITVRGVEYPDDHAVAAAFGICRKAVRNAVNKGRQDFIGIPAHKTRTKTGLDPMPVRVRGKTFPSAKAAAKHFKVAECTVNNAIAEGREDFVGLGRSRKHSKVHVGRTPVNAKAIHIGPYSWPSKRQCARALEVGVTTLREHLLAGDTVWLAARAMDYAARIEGHKKRLPDMISEEERATRGVAMIEAWKRRRANADQGRAAA